MTQTFSDLFDPVPEQWGLRGDPFLWDELCAFLSSEKMPNSASAVRTMIERAIKTLTGAPFDGTDYFRVERYPDEGMSGGYISMQFWTMTAIPLLVSRFKGLAPKTRDYFAELYVAGLFGDAGWAVYFPKRDVGFDFIVSKDVNGTMLLRPVQVKGLYPTLEKRDQDIYGFSGQLSAIHPEMVVALPFFSAAERGAAPACIAYMPLARMRSRERGGVRCAPCRLVGGVPQPRQSYYRFMDQLGLAAVEHLDWSVAPE